jgi:hypothetical protein
MWSSVNVQIINGSTKAAGSGSTAAELVFARNVLSDRRAIALLQRSVPNLVHIRLRVQEATHARACFA